MKPSTTLIRSSDGTANASLMTVQTLRSPGATSIITNTVAGAPTKFYATMGTPHTFTDPVTSEVITIVSEASAVDFAGHLNNGHVEIDAIAPGYTDKGSAVGDVIIIRPITGWANNLADVIEQMALNPVGMIAPFAGATAPNFWLLCDGSSILRATYPDLFTAIGTTYGSADATHFNVPDLRSRMPVGVGQSSVTVTAVSVDITNDALILSATDIAKMQTGMAVTIASTGTVPTGLTAGTTYYAIVSTAVTNGLKLSTSRANAVAGVVIDITSVGSGTITAASSYSARTLGQVGGEETHTLATAEIPIHNHRIRRDNSSGGFTPQNGIPGSIIVGTTSTSGVNGVFSDRGGSDYNSGSGITETIGSSVAANVMNPFLALNYIIKT